MGENENDNDEEEGMPAPASPTELLEASVVQAERQRELNKAEADLADLTTRCEYEVAYVETINAAREKLIERVAELKKELGVG